MVEHFFSLRPLALRLPVRRPFRANMISVYLCGCTGAGSSIVRIRSTVKRQHIIRSGWLNKSRIDVVMSCTYDKRTNKTESGTRDEEKERRKEKEQPTTTTFMVFKNSCDVQDRQFMLRGRTRRFMLDTKHSNWNRHPRRREKSERMNFHLLNNQNLPDLKRKKPLQISLFAFYPHFRNSIS